MNIFKMKLSILVGIFVATFVAISHSNPNLKKGELIESIIIHQTQGNYAEVINLFAAIGKLAKNHTVDLSEKEQKLFFDCYHYRRMQLRKDLVKTNENNGLKFLNKEAVETKTQFYNSIKHIIDDLAEGSSFQLSRKPDQTSNYDYFLKKCSADRLYFEGWYSFKEINDFNLGLSFQEYEQVLGKLRTFLGDAGLTVLDACLGFSTAKLEYLALHKHGQLPAPTPCDAAQNCIDKGRIASSDSNPDLFPLTQFVTTYCKPDAPNIIKDKMFLRSD